MKTRVLLDTDIGGDIDDTWALALALRCPEIDLRLVLTDTAATLELSALMVEPSVLSTAMSCDLK